MTASLLVLLVLPTIEPEQLHLDEPARVELELARSKRLLPRVRSDRRELEDDLLVALDERVHEQLVRPSLELEMLERIDVETDRQRREVRRNFGVIDDDSLDPPRSMRNELASAHIAIRYGLFEERSQEVEEVGPT